MDFVRRLACVCAFRHTHKRMIRLDFVMNHILFWILPELWSAICD